MSGVASGGGPSYALYRASGLGKAFSETIEEMFHEQEMTNDQAIQALLAFDKSFNDHLADKSPVNKLSVEGHLANYRFCDGVWTLNLRHAQIHGAEGSLAVPAIKIVACEAKNKTKKTRK